MSNIKNNEILLDKIRISMDETHHIYNNLPLYNEKYDLVMSYHAPGLAAVKDKSGAYHINLKGESIYSEKFQQAFGYYEGLAAVVNELGWFHIGFDGKSQYTERYEWVGNFQESRSPVKNIQGEYFHIKIDGSPAYNKRYNYVGDYKYGIAVVYEEDGYARHIDSMGKLLNSGSYLELSVFHKGYAVARDGIGYFHIRKDGFPIYENRYQWVEPFYNGFAFVLKFNGEKVVINQNGEEIHKIYSQSNRIVKDSIRDTLMVKLVGYWETQIIYAITRFDFFDIIKNGNTTFSSIRKVLGIPKESLKLIVEVLKLWQFIKEENEQYRLTYLGKLLTEDHPERLKYAALMWGEEHYKVMSRLYEALRTYKPQFKEVFGREMFDYFMINKERGIVYNKALEEYSLDYDSLLNLLDFSHINSIIDVGGGRGILLRKILKKFKHIDKGILFDLPSVIEENKLILSEQLNSRIELSSGNFFDNIPGKYDAIILSRVLHDWSDDKSSKLLNNLKDALNSDGFLLIFEMVVPENNKTDFGTTLNFNLLVCVGGKERTKNEFNNLLNAAGFFIEEIHQSEGIISLIKAKMKLDKNLK